MAKYYANLSIVSRMVTIFSSPSFCLGFNVMIPSNEVSDPRHFFSFSGDLTPQLYIVNILHGLSTEFRNMVMERACK